VGYVGTMLHGPLDVAAAGDFLATLKPIWLRPVALILLGAGLVVVTVFLALGDLV
jgi:hypothetical protein